MTVLSDTDIISLVAKIDAEVQSLADNAKTIPEQFRYSNASIYTARAATIHQEERRWSDLSDSYRYHYNLTQAADHVRPVNRSLAIRLVRLANQINPPSTDDAERPDFYPGVG